MCDAVADYLEEAKLDTDDAETVLNIVEDTFIDPDFDNKWKPYRIELVKNKHLETEFEGEYNICNIMAIFLVRSYFTRNLYKCCSYYHSSSQ